MSYMPDQVTDFQIVSEFYTRGFQHPLGASFFELAVKEKGGYLARRYVIGENIDFFVECSGIIRQFFVKHKDIIVVPLDTLWSIQGFLVRSTEGKNFLAIDLIKPHFYGLHRFKDFKYNDLIVVVEGIKDAEAVAKVYPFVLASLGVSISVKQREFLQLMSSNVVFISDADFWGRISGKSLKRYGIAVVVPPFKDLGVYFEGECYQQGVLSFVEGVVSLYR